MAKESSSNISSFFSDFELEYTITFHASDGVMLLDHDSSLCAYLNEKDVNDLSKAKTREDVMKVINRLEFDR
ncbi:hypothetical protein V6380_17185 [Acinetobacter variabilis]|uniref:hypothetical protein n=1 Tax=Acinetobacter variabilis TaxID=70346 RepID=UPI003B84357C